MRQTTRNRLHSEMIRYLHFGKDLDKARICHITFRSEAEITDVLAGGTLVEALERLDMERLADAVDSSHAELLVELPRKRRSLKPDEQEISDLVGAFLQRGAAFAQARRLARRSRGTG